MTSAPYDWAEDDQPPPQGWPAGFSLIRNPDGYDWTISLPADAEPGCLDDAIQQALDLNQALRDVLDPDAPLPGELPR